MEPIAVVKWKDANDKPHWEYFYDVCGVVISKVIKGNYIFDSPRYPG